MKLSPEHDSFGPMVAQQVFAEGAAKIGGYISLAAVADMGEIMAQGVTPLEQLDKAVACDTGLQEVVACFAGTATDLAKNFVTASTPTHDASIEDAIKSHQDDEGGRNGVSLIIPLEGPKGLFGAADRSFDLYGDADRREPTDNGPKLLWRYGPGDMLLLRQAVFKVNDQKVRLTPVEHVGRSNGTRKLLIIDIGKLAFRITGVDLP